MGLRIWRIPYLCQYLDVCTRTSCCRKRYAAFVGMFQVMIATGSLLGGYVVDHFNENTLIYGVLSFVALALISTFTLAKGLNNPKATCEN